MDAALRQAVLKAASLSPLMFYSWHGRGQAPAGYTKGLALAFAQCYLDLIAGDSSAHDMAKPIGGPSTDVLAHFHSELASSDMLDHSPVDNLRHLFVIMYGLGMRESSGQYCEGRDVTAQIPPSADTAEAGMFQQSWDSHRASVELPKLLAKYSAPGQDCMLDVFKEGVHKSIAPDWGSGEGAKFQNLAKHCPMFAAAAAAVGLRNLRTHWGPINRHEVEVRNRANNLLIDVQRLVDASQQPKEAPGVGETPAPVPTPPPVAPTQPVTPVPPPPVGMLPPPPKLANEVVHNAWPTQAQCDSYYGNPRLRTPWELSNLVPFAPPWKMIDEDSKRPVPMFKVHKRVKPSLDRIFIRIWNMYGQSQAEIDKRHMNLFSGCYVFRNIRGSNRLSMHSYGIALDIAAGLNALGAPYDPKRGIPLEVIKCFEDEGWTWGGRWRGRPDAMHFQAARVG